MLSPALAFHTIRHLKPTQVLNRVVRSAASRPRLPRAGAAQLRLRTPQLPCAPRVSFENGSFSFLRQRFPFSGQYRWQPADAPRLWTYHLHYFRYVHAADPRDAWSLIHDWIDQNPCWFGPGWEPYPLSLRIREWIEWALAHPALPPDSRSRITDSLVMQIQALEAQLEYHLLGNHLLENAITLCWAGLSLDTSLAEGWLHDGHRLLQRELSVQVLRDGTHDERSPMYQASIAESLLRLSAVAAGGHQRAASDVARLAADAGRALARSLSLLSHPDGHIALLNDAALEEAPSAIDLAKRFDLPPAPPREASWHLHDAGYMGCRSDRAWLVFDAGPIGPDHQPGHGHADTLSFELSHRGQRLVTDTGVMTYAPGPTRAYDRGTAAHNTVQVDDTDQCELWAAFRCGRRVRIDEAAATATPGAVRLHGKYSGPGRHGRPIRHARGVRMREQSLTFSDHIVASRDHDATLRLHLAPGVAAVSGDGVIRLEREGSAVAAVRGDGFEWTIGESPYHPEFGLELNRVCLQASFRFSDELSLAWTLELS